MNPFDTNVTLYFNVFHYLKQQGHIQNSIKHQDGAFCEND